MMKPTFDKKSPVPFQILNVLQRLTSRRNAMLLVRLVGAFVIIVCLYTAVFHLLMHSEGQSHTLLTGLYWTFTTMTTLGLGDVVFASDVGRLFTVLTLMTGVVFLLVMIPFTTIQLFQSSARIPRELPSGTHNHVILTSYDPLTIALIEKLRRVRHEYVLLRPDLADAMRLIDHGVRTVLGELDDPQTYKEVRVDHAALVVASDSDVINTSLTYTVRQVTETTPIIATASGEAAGDVLRAAGCMHVLTLDELLGQSMARRIVAGDAMAHVIGQMDDLLIAEATVTGTPLRGKTLGQVDLPRWTGVSVVGVWEGGEFSLPDEVSAITDHSVLVIVGSQAQIDRYNELFCIYNVHDAPVLIVGAGNVGQATAKALRERGLEYRIVDRSADLIAGWASALQGDAMKRITLDRAGFFSAPTVVITTRDDATNIYLTTYYRHLRKDIQIISRATMDRSIPILQAAGCDFVVSYASLGANSIFNLLKRGNILLVAEGVDVFKVRLPESLAGKTIRESGVREECRCSIIGISDGSMMQINPRPDAVLKEGAEIVLIGDAEGEAEFFRRYGTRETSG